MTTIKQYFDQIKEWETLYGKPRFRAFDPTATRACCAKCGKIKKKMSRHHTANDYFFATLMPAVFAARYIEFHKDDVVKLCDRCHKMIHKFYAPIAQRMWQDYPGPVDVTVEWCEKWKTEFRAAFKKWITLPVRTRRRKRRRSSTAKREA